MTAFRSFIHPFIHPSIHTSHCPPPFTLFHSPLSISSRPWFSSPRSPTFLISLLLLLPFFSSAAAARTPTHAPARPLPIGSFPPSSATPAARHDHPLPSSVCPIKLTVSIACASCPRCLCLTAGALQLMRLIADCCNIQSFILVQSFNLTVSSSRASSRSHASL